MTMASSAEAASGVSPGVEVVGLRSPAGDDPLEVAAQGGPSLRRCPLGPETQAQLGRLARLHGHHVPEGALGAGPLRAHGGRPADDMVVDPVLGIPGAGCQAVQAAHVRLVVTEQQGRVGRARSGAADQLQVPEERVGGRH